MTDVTGSVGKEAAASVEAKVGGHDPDPHAAAPTRTGALVAAVKKVVGKTPKAPEDKPFSTPLTSGNVPVPAPITGPAST